MFLLVPADCCSDRLSNFILEILDTNNHTVWSYEGPVNASLVYELNTLQQKPVKTIRIIATRIEVNTKPPLVTLCEVFLFGGNFVSLKKILKTFYFNFRFKHNYKFIYGTRWLSSWALDFLT